MEMGILITTYPWDAGAVTSSADKCDNIRAMRVYVHCKLVQVVKEQLELEEPPQSAKHTMKISYRCSVYVFGIDTPNAQSSYCRKWNQSDGEKNGYMKIVLATEMFYATRELKFETVFLQTGKICRKGINHNNIWFTKSLLS